MERQILSVQCALHFQLRCPVISLCAETIVTGIYTCMHHELIVSYISLSLCIQMCLLNTGSREVIADHAVYTLITAIV